MNKEKRKDPRIADTFFFQLFEERNIKVAIASGKRDRNQGGRGGEFVFSFLLNGVVPLLLIKTGCPMCRS